MLGRDVFVLFMFVSLDLYSMYSKRKFGVIVILTSRCVFDNDSHACDRVFSTLMLRNILTPCTQYWCTRYCETMQMRVDVSSLVNGITANTVMQHGLPIMQARGNHAEKEIGGISTKSHCNLLMIWNKQVHYLTGDRISTQTWVNICWTWSTSCVLIGHNIGVSFAWVAQCLLITDLSTRFSLLNCMHVDTGKSRCKTLVSLSVTSCSRRNTLEWQFSSLQQCQCHVPWSSMAVAAALIL